MTSSSGVSSSSLSSKSSSSNKSIDKSSSRSSSSSKDNSASNGVSSIAGSSSVTASFFDFFFGVTISVSSVSFERRFKRKAIPIRTKLAGNVAIKIINQSCDVISWLSSSACCFSSSRSLSFSCRLKMSSCCKRIISSICTFNSFPLITSLFISPTFSFTLVSRSLNTSFSFKSACKPSIESSTSF